MPMKAAPASSRPGRDPFFDEHHHRVARGYLSNACRMNSSKEPASCSDDSSAKPIRVDGATHGVMVQTELAGDGSDLPVLGRPHIRQRGGHCHAADMNHRARFTSTRSTFVSTVSDV
jgi:hypothetical protein